MRLAGFLFAFVALPLMASDVVFENDVARLVLGTDGIARSLKIKATGEELLAQPAVTPVACIEHARPYDKIAQLTHPAQMRTFLANRIERKGDVLEIGFAGTRDTIDVRVTVEPDRFDFSFGGFGIASEAFGPKWTWRPEGVRFLQLTFAKRAHFGEWMNVVWDDRASGALMGVTPETRIAADVRDTGDLTLFAEGEARVGFDGLAASVIPAETPHLLDAVDAFERDHGLPRGVEARRSPRARESYFWAKDVTPATADRLIAAAKAGGFPLFMISYTSFARTCGHYLWNTNYPQGMADLKAVVDKVRVSGMTPGLHIHYSKVSRDDPYVSAATPDTRFNIVSTFFLAADVDAAATELQLQAKPVDWNPEDGRRLVQIGREWIEFAGVSASAPWRLVGCTRGFLGSTAAAHAANEPMRHVDVDNWVRFLRLDADSAIADEVADRIAGIYRACGFAFAYFDGAEDVPQPYWYHVTKAQKRVWDRLAPAPCVAETYVRNHWGWHMFARGNAFDPYPPGRVEEAYFKYQEPCMREARENFTTVDLGWADLKGKTVADFTFMADKARQWNAPLALWTDLRQLEENPATGRILAVFRDLNGR